MAVSPFASIRSLARKTLRPGFYKRLQVASGKELTSDALVVAPHQDDETLACGGTILQKTKAGARVRAVFMSDGTSSHPQWLDAEKLSRQRIEEAEQAGRQLGIQANDMHFANLPDGALAKQIEEGAAVILEQLQQFPVPQLFLPYRAEPPADHWATWKMACRAAELWDKPLTMHEYPIWFWESWPWMQSGPRNCLRDLRNWRRLRRDFRYAVPIGDVHADKHKALACHKSQMQRPTDHPDWPILADVSDGEFLDCFFQEFEVFYRYEFCSARTST